jgi:hypothetical protein
MERSTKTGVMDTAPCAAVGAPEQLVVHLESEGSVLDAPPAACRGARWGVDMTGLVRADSVWNHADGSNWTKGVSADTDSTSRAGIQCTPRRPGRPSVLAGCRPAAPGKSKSAALINMTSAPTIEGLIEALSRRNQTDANKI